MNGLAINAAQQFLSAKFGPESSPHAIGSYIQFLSRVQPGVVFFSCHLLRRSSFQIVVRVELAPDSQTRLVTDAPGSGLSAVAIITFGNMFKEVGLSQETISSIMTDLPNRERDCQEIDDPYMRATPMTRKFRWWSPRNNSPNGNGLWGHRAGGHIRDTFISLADGSPVGLYEITWFADIGFQPPLTHERDLPLYWQVSTTSIAIEYKRPIPKDLEWALVRTNSHVVRHGRYDIDIFIVDPADNGILVLARHLVYVRPFKMLSSKNGGEKDRTGPKI
ncbi:hypothetical protein OIDMADRAFT_40868 [Oidiodendron maius Zn]|uniref:Acyl-CoA thioesterase-like C-terminal domain-containing protein n=1 Tax=Oidiodendron maius (strain Zn) TaxID=913774 RepID=A0A0C3DMP8_OIDMZ|nr:hypothetical protein OIDMADRAFT_40868 [Oidiodendron maius Zn]